MAKIFIHRGDNLTSIPRFMTSDEGKRMLEDAGFSMIRSDTHRIFRRGDQQIVLSSSGNLSPWLTQLVYKAAAQAKEQEGPAGKQEVLPLTVSYNGKPYAVDSRGITTYRLIDMDDGSKSSVPINQCRPVTLEIPPIPKEVPKVMEGVPPEMATQESVREPTPAIEVFSSSNQMATWLQQSQRLLSTLDVKAEQLENQLLTINQQRAGLNQIINTFTGKTDTPVPPARRVSPGKPKNSSGSGITNQQKEDIYRLTNEGHTASSISSIIGVSTSAIYYWIGKGRQEGKVKLVLPD